MVLSAGMKTTRFFEGEDAGGGCGRGGAVRARNVERVRQALAASDASPKRSCAEADSETETPSPVRRCPCVFQFAGDGSGPLTLSPVLVLKNRSSLRRWDQADGARRQAGVCPMTKGGVGFGRSR